MTPQSINAPWATGLTDSTTAIFIPATGWMSASQIKLVRVVWELIVLLADLDVRPAYQVSDSADGNLTTFPVDTAFKDSSDVYYPSQWHDASANVAGKQLIRFGWEIKLKAGTAITAGRMAGKFELKPQ
jgi:hypothetical protein